jgi:hypothetical protein
MKNVILVTTMWGKIDQVKGAENEAELCQTGNFWGGMLARGSKVVRYYRKKEEGEALVLELVNRSPVIMKLQKEIAVDGKSLIDPDAGSSINEELLKAKLEYQEELEIVKEEMAAAMEASKHFTTSLHPWIFKLEVSNHNYRKSS